MDVDGQRLRVRPPQVATQGLPDTPSKRHLPLVWCRWLVEAHGKPLFPVPAVAGSVGSVRWPATSHVLERFCRAFQRVYATRGGLHAGLRATRERLRLLVVSVFTQQATTGRAPIAGSVPAARRLPL